MSSRRSPLAHHHSLFYRDLASPSPTSAATPRASSRFATPGQAAASSLWKQSFSPDLPPPPAFTLEDRADFSPEAAPGELPPPSSPSLSPSSSFRLRRTPSRSDPRPKFGDAPSPAPPSPPQAPESFNWWSPVKEDRGKGKEKEGSPVDGVVEPAAGALIVLPPPREVVRPEVQERSVPIGALDEEEWVTIYGFSPADTNLVLREFEKCGPILQHVLGPRDANWMHVLYQNRYDAQKALQKNGIQLNSVLIVGVKPVDPMQQQFLNERHSGGANKGFMVSLPPPLVNGAHTVASSHSKSSTHILNGGGGISDGGRRMDGAIATPARSFFSKAVDLMFGL